jgi:carboxymethylenebutenolidase
MTQPTRVEDVEFGRFHQPVASEGAARIGGVPGLVFVHDVMGPSEHSQALARDLAAEGFGVLEIDLYRNLDTFSLDDVGAHILSLPDPEILADLDAGADWLGQTDSVRGRAVGIVGVCMGGTFTLLAACTSNRFRAAAPFYGILSYDTGLLANPTGRDSSRKPTSPIEAGGQLRTPLLASFGAEDAFVPAHDVLALETALRTSGVAFEIDRYPGAGHAFLNRTRPAAYHEDASRVAWARVIPFLHAELD